MFVCPNLRIIILRPSIIAGWMSTASHRASWSDSRGGAQGEKPGARADIGDDIALDDPEEIEKFLRLLALDSLRSVEPPGMPRIDQLGLTLDAEWTRLCRILYRQEEKQRQQYQTAGASYAGATL